MKLDVLIIFLLISTQLLACENSKERCGEIGCSKKFKKISDRWVGVNQSDVGDIFHVVGSCQGRGKYLFLKLDREYCCRGALISEKDSSLTEFAVEYFDGISWREAYRGKKSSLKQFFNFNNQDRSVKSSFYRLHFLKSKSMPSIDSFVLYY